MSLWQKLKSWFRITPTRPVPPQSEAITSSPMWCVLSVTDNTRLSVISEGLTQQEAKRFAALGEMHSRDGVMFAVATKHEMQNGLVCYIEHADLHDTIFLFMQCCLCGRSVRPGKYFSIKGRSIAHGACLLQEGIDNGSQP